MVTVLLSGPKPAGQMHHSHPQVSLHGRPICSVPDKLLCVEYISFLDHPVLLPASWRGPEAGSTVGRFNARQGSLTPQERDPMPLRSPWSRGSQHPRLHCARGAGRASGPLPDPLPLDTQVPLKTWQQNKPSASSRKVPEGPNEDSGPTASSFSSPRPFNGLVLTAVSNHNYWLWRGVGGWGGI